MQLRCWQIRLFFVFSHTKMAEMSETLTLPLEFKHIAEFKSLKTSLIISDALSTINTLQLIPLSVCLIIN